MKNWKRGTFGLSAVFCVFAVMAFAFAVTACNHGGDDGGGGGAGGMWRVSQYRYYNVIDGTVEKEFYYKNDKDPMEPGKEPVKIYTNKDRAAYSYTYNYISYLDDKHCEYEYNYDSYTSTSSSTYSYSNQINYIYHVTKDGQNSTENMNSESWAYTYTNNTSSYAYSETTSSSSYSYDLETGLTKSTSTTTNTESITPSANNTSSGYSELSYLIDLIGEANGVRTYKQYATRYISNSAGLDATALGYTEYKIQNGRIIEAKWFTANGLLQSITTYTMTENPEILLYLGEYWVSSTTYPSNPENNSYSTVEALNTPKFIDSGIGVTEEQYYSEEQYPMYTLVLRTKTFTNGRLSSQYDTYYENSISYLSPTTSTPDAVEEGNYRVNDGNGNVYTVYYNKEYEYRVSNGKAIIYRYKGDVGVKTKGTVTIPSRLGGYPVTEIGGNNYSNIFNNCFKLTGVNIPEGVTTIGQGAFYYCIRLTNITIPSSVTTIGDSSFYECWNLSSIIIPDGVTSIGERAFSGTAWLKNQQDGVVYAGKVAYAYKGTTLPSTISFNDGTKGIAGYFCNNISYNNSYNYSQNLTSLTIPASVTTIGDRAFAYYNYLTSVTFSTGSNIADADFGDEAFPGSQTYNDLKNAYRNGKAGTYTLSDDYNRGWTKQP